MDVFLHANQSNMNTGWSVDMDMTAYFSDVWSNELLLQGLKTIDHAEPVICTIHVQVLQQVVLREQEEDASWCSKR